MDQSKHLSGMAQQHVSHCAGCRQFYEACISLGEGLKHEAAPRRRISEQLSRRVVEAMPRGPATTQKTGIRLRPVIAAACLAAVVAAVALSVALDRRSRARQYKEAVEDVQEFVAFVRTGNAQRASGGLSSARGGLSGLFERPLQGEVRSLAEDTESAVRFLVACVAVDIPGPADESMN
jgi:hypothetical protein